MFTELINSVKEAFVTQPVNTVEAEPVGDDEMILVKHHLSVIIDGEFEVMA
jgi:hypothetical protein